MPLNYTAGSNYFIKLVSDSELNSPSLTAGWLDGYLNSSVFDIGLRK